MFVVGSSETAFLLLTFLASFKTWVPCLGSSAALHDAHLQALKDCSQSGPLGMISGDIKDWQISASSTLPLDWDKGCHERYARIYQPNGFSWCAKYKAPSEWLQVDLGVAAKVTGVMTQGRGNGAEWVTSYMVTYSLDAHKWQYVEDLYGNQRVFEGNSNSHSVKHTYLDQPIIARFIRFQTIHWNQHPSLRVEIIGCQVCKTPLALPPYGRVAASSEKIPRKINTCTAEDGFIVTNKGWCAKTNNDNQWLQFDVGPPTLVTGLVTKGHGDGGKKQWVTRFRISYSNDSQIWYYYKDANNLDSKHTVQRTDLSLGRSSSYLLPDHRTAEGMEFGGNVDKSMERIHYLNSPFVARFVRFHPKDWNRHISMRAGLFGCPYRGDCPIGFMRINEYTPCVANIALKRESYITVKKQYKRHARHLWTSNEVARKAVDGDTDQNLHSCTRLDNFHIDKPIWMVDLGTQTQVSGVMIVTWQGKGEAESTISYKQYLHSLEKLAVYVDNRGGTEPIDVETKMCGFVSRLNDALFQRQLHVQCVRPMHGRYVYVEATQVPSKLQTPFKVVLCEVMVYE